jgi:hypothetical protein
MYQVENNGCKSTTSMNHQTNIGWNSPRKNYVYCNLFDAIRKCPIELDCNLKMFDRTIL